MSACHKGILVVVVSVAAAGPVCAWQPAKLKAAPAASDVVLVVVNGQKVTEADVTRRMKTRQVPEDEWEKLRGPYLEKLIDVRLIQQFLASRKAIAAKKEIDDQVNLVRENARKGGRDPDKFLAESGYTPESLREELALPIAWKHHIDRAVTSERLKKYFEEHRPEFDGTRVRARQILIKAPPGDEAARDAAVARLSDLRKQIAARKISFEDAAREHSESPSKAEGGDVGLFPYAGKMPQEFSREAFQLKVGEISQPFRSRYGVHLCLVTDRQAGDLSLEDVRDEVLARLSRELLEEQTAELRKTAKIEWKIEKP